MNRFGGGRQERLWAAAVGVLLFAAILVNLVALQPGTGEDVEWGVPRWLPGDRFTVRGEVGSGADVEDREWAVELGSEVVPYLDSRGEQGEAVEYWPSVGRTFVDLERGVSAAHVQPSAAGMGGTGGAVAVTLIPGFWVREPALGVQGVMLYEGRSWTVPYGWSGNHTHYRVVELDASGAVIEALTEPYARNAYAPGLPENRTEGHLLYYARGAPYPYRSVHWADRSGESERIAERSLVESELREGDRTPDREPPLEGPWPRPDVDSSVWHRTLTATGLVSPMFDLAEVFEAAREDPGVGAFREARPEAFLAEMRFVIARNQDRDEWAYAWNLSFVDPRDGAAHAFVRVRYVEPLLEGLEPGEGLGIMCGEEIDGSLGGAGLADCGVEDHFVHWRSGPFRVAQQVGRYRITYPFPEAIGAGPQVQPEEALRVFSELNPEAEPVALGWSVLGHRAGRDGLFRAEVDSVVYQSSWAMGWGELLYPETCRSGEDPEGCDINMNFRHNMMAAATGEVLFLTLPAESAGPYEFPPSSDRGPGRGVV